MLRLCLRSFARVVPRDLHCTRRAIPSVDEPAFKGWSSGGRVSKRAGERLNSRIPCPTPAQANAMRWLAPLAIARVTVANTAQRATMSRIRPSWTRTASCAQRAGNRILCHRHSPPRRPGGSRRLRRRWLVPRQAAARQLQHRGGGLPRDSAQRQCAVSCATRPRSASVAGFMRGATRCRSFEPGRRRRARHGSPGPRRSGEDRLVQDRAAGRRIPLDSRAISASR